ncbi:hypothetical protein B0T17DRAFT_501581 [Bombardia bombarda]|uniref:FAD-binding domain-containing protein n=1 Tax=Bombardia bombarda TaxID=252184 RepID=A0AA39T0L4_9PEZI|nr:hypothetical protein B0T17DRAFT_501581 [Bombardia bombarda]
MAINTPTIKVAIIGGGPGGLAAAIELGKLPFVSWTLYEKKPQISETGGGISLQRHTWRMLELLGADGNITAGDYFRPEDGHTVQHRNARDGTLLGKSYTPEDTPPKQASCRMVRPKLQGALLKEVDQAKIQLSKKLVAIEKLQDGGKLRIVFEDGFEDEVDLLVGADGIRSAVRQFLFPSHNLSYIGQSAYRTLTSTSAISAHLTSKNIEFAPLRGPIFWHNVGGKYVYTCPLGGDVFEVTARIRRLPDGQDHVSWGQPYDLHHLLSEYEEFCPAVREILTVAAAEGNTQEFAMFSGPRLERCVGDEDRGEAVALLGDASHPLSGAFGAGAGFALEDAYTLGKALEWSFGRRGDGSDKGVDVERAVAEGLRLYDRTRSPHYKDLYGVLDKMGALNAALVKEGLPVDDEISERVKRAWGAKNDWMYYYKADEIIRLAILELDRKEGVEEVSNTVIDGVGNVKLDGSEMVEVRIGI